MNWDDLIYDDGEKPTPSIPVIELTYFVKIGKLVKIGKTTQLKKRLGGLRCRFKSEVEILALTTKYSEREMHHKFDPYYLGAELFILSDEILNFIDSLKEETKSILKTEDYEKKAPGRPKGAGTAPLIHFRSFIKLAGKEVRVLLEDGLELYAELKRLALQQEDKKVIEILKNNKALDEVLKKWEANKKNE